MAYFGFVFSPKIFFFKNDPGEGWGIASGAMEVRADNLADAAPGAEGFIGDDHAPGQNYLLPVGEGKNLQQVTRGENAPQAEKPEGNAF